LQMTLVPQFKNLSRAEMIRWSHGMLARHRLH
jgi:hypothetical protein